MDLQAKKTALRSNIRAELKKLSEAKRLKDSAHLRARLLRQDVWNNARSVSFFAPMSEEADIWPLMTEALKSGKTVALPRFSREAQSYVVCLVEDMEEDVKAGSFGIREPTGACREIPMNRLDLILVPGLAFDLNGRRLGKGKGYYDRLLAGVSGIKCGVAFDEQVVSEVPAGPHDVRVNCILTPTRWLEFRL
jgi:5-formyltetrahydrofolate cyclo-ligase